MSAHSISSLLLLPGLAFEALVRARNSLYTRGVLPQQRLGCPVISVGNLNLGGSGKTPLVIYLARMLVELGTVPALLSRGYGRSSGETTRVIAPGGDIPALAVGDEPALVRRHIPEIWLGISPNRYGAGRQILEGCPSPIFILDDGFQHRGLHRDLDIVVIDATQPLDGDRVIPRGRLREPLTGLRRATLVMINAARSVAKPDPLEDTIRRIDPEARIFHCSQRIRTILPWERWKDPRSDGGTFSNYGPAFLVAAVGNPSRFERDVRDLGIPVTGALFFRDHHELAVRDWDECIARARSSGAGALIITEKDAIKLKHSPEFPLLVSVQSTDVEPKDEFTRIVRKVAGP